MRVLIAQLTEIEGTALGNAQCLVQQFGRIEFAQLLVWPQMSFAVGKQTESGLGHGDVMAHGGEGVLQGAPAAGMHMHITGRHGGNAQFSGQLLQVFQTLRIVRPAMQFDGQPQSLREALAQPAALLALPAPLGCFVRYPEHEQTGHWSGEILAQQPVLAFLRPAPGLSNQLAEPLIALEVLHQEHDLGAVVNTHLAADDQRQLALLRRLPGADDAGQGAFIGDGQFAIAMRPGALEQLLGAGGSALETEVRQAVQLGVFPTHANQPCSSKGPCSATSR